MNITKLANAISIFANFADDNDDYVSINHDDPPFDNSLNAPFNDNLDPDQFVNTFLSLPHDQQKSIFNQLSNHFINEPSIDNDDLNLNDDDLNDDDDLDLNNISNISDDDLDPNSLPGDEPFIDDSNLDDDLNLDDNSNLDDDLDSDPSFDDE